MPTIFLNDEKIEFSTKAMTIEKILKSNNINTNGIAIALNSHVIRSNMWANTVLTDNDRLLIVTAAQGG